MKTIQNQTDSAPRPILQQALQTWRIEPGMLIALAQDMEGQLWVVENCPAGSWCWTIEQAKQLSGNSKTGMAFREAVRAGRRLQRLALQKAHRQELQETFGRLACVLK